MDRVSWTRVKELPARVGSIWVLTANGSKWELCIGFSGFFGKWVTRRRHKATTPEVGEGTGAPG